MDVVYAIVLVGVLVLVHELGHFTWAKIFGVRVLRFSIGFGPKIAGFTRAGTEYVLAAFPLGGYVLLLGENPHEKLSKEDEEHAFHNQPLWKRVVVVFAGPLMNLLFPLVLYFVVFLGTTQLLPPVIGTVFPDRPADGKLVPGDRVLAIDGEAVTTFDDMMRIVGGSGGRTLRFEVQRGDERVTTSVTPALTVERRPPLDIERDVYRIGVMAAIPAPVVGVDSPASPAGAAHLMTFDRIVSVGGQRIDTFLDLGRVLDRNQGSMLPVTYLRPVRIEGALGGLMQLDVYEPHVATLAPEPGHGGGLGRTGLELADLYVAKVEAGSPEHRLGLLPGDRLVTLDDRPIRNFETFKEDLRVGGNHPHTLVWRRGDRVMSGRLVLAHERGETEEGIVYDRYALGIANWRPTEAPPLVENPHPITYAMGESIEHTSDIVELMLFSFVRMLQGRLSVTKSISGPIKVFEYAGAAAREGALDFLALMAFLSLNLGLINLLPIPRLDGGQLVFFAIEAVTRRPLPQWLREYASVAGLLMIAALMVLAFRNDLAPHWETFIDSLATGE